MVGNFYKLKKKKIIAGISHVPNWTQINFFLYSFFYWAFKLSCSLQIYKPKILLVQLWILQNTLFEMEWIVHVSFPFFFLNLSFLLLLSGYSWSLLLSLTSTTVSYFIRHTYFLGYSGPQKLSLKLKLTDTNSLKFDVHYLCSFFCV